MDISSRLGPVWLDKFLQQGGEYFKYCDIHVLEGNGTRKRKFFCITCMTGPHCTVCKRTEHDKHEILQVRRTSSMPSIAVEDISERVDCSGLEIYSINHDKVYFLTGKPRQNPVEAQPKCHECRRNLMTNTAMFCSISCKLKCIPREVGLTLTLTPPTPPDNSGNDMNDHPVEVVPQLHPPELKVKVTQAKKKKRLSAERAAKHIVSIPTTTSFIVSTPTSFRPSTPTSFRPSVSTPTSFRPSVSTPTSFRPRERSRKGHPTRAPMM